MTWCWTRKIFFKVEWTQSFAGADTKSLINLSFSPFNVYRTTEKRKIFSFSFNGKSGTKGKAGKLNIHGMKISYLSRSRQQTISSHRIISREFISRPMLSCGFAYKFLRKETQIQLRCCFLTFVHNKKIMGWKKRGKRKSRAFEEESMIALWVFK